MDKYDTSQLTEFPRFEPESTQSGVTTFFNKLWRFPLFSPNEPSDSGQNKSPNDGQQQSEPSEMSTKQNYEDIKPDTGRYAVEIEARSLPNVLRRISNLIALGSGGGTRYADTEMARYWMPDDISRECYECATRFSALRRRHHCRVCGQIFCNRCCSQRVPGQIFGCAGGLRVCNYCSNVVLSYLRENDLSGDISPDLRTLQENLQVKFPENKSSEQTKNRDNFMFAREQNERNELRASPKEALQDVFRQLSTTLPTQQHRYRLVRYNGVWRGCDVLQWIMDHTNNKTRVQATSVCQALLNEGYMECMSELPKFADYALYKPSVLPPATPQEEPPEECNRLVESVSSYCLDLNLGDSSARLIKAPKTEKKSPSSEEDNPLIQHTESPVESKECKAIAECGEEHLQLLLRQCLAREGLQPSWAPIVYPLCQQAAHMIVPDLYGGDIDPRHYVQVKKAAGGAPRASRVLAGVALSANVAHRGMPARLRRPALLLLDCSVAYQRVEGRLATLEPLLLQEQEYLVRCAARISALKPNVVLVRGTAARTVQDALRKEGVALATGVGERALARVARCSGADVATSVDARVALPALGTCGEFYVQAFSGKTLMVLEDCAHPNLGCCILLRGASLPELVRVKRVVKFMLLACYNWKLEKMFLNDIGAVLPEPGMTFEDDTNENDANGDESDAAKATSDVDDDKVHFDVEDATPGDDKVHVDVDDAVKGENVDVDAIVEVKNDADPLRGGKSFVRKMDSDKNLSCGVLIRDFSDPLRARQSSLDDEVFLPRDEKKLIADSVNDRWSTDDVVLSMSPNVVISAPFLETEAGRKCPLRQYFHDPLFPTVRTPIAITPKSLRKSSVRRTSREPVVLIKDAHPFIRSPVTRADAAALAHFRAVGSRLADAHRPNCPLYKAGVAKKMPERESEAGESETQCAPPDPLSPENHQRLSLLLSSYSSKSANVPDFCVNPWTVTMELYGRHDISLGAFLEKYCFNNDYKCPSANCQVPMNQHVRRFVHGDGCITITCNTIGHSSVDKVHGHQDNQIMFWSRCARCGAAGGARVVGAGARALALGAYLSLRARGAGRLARARACACRRPLAAHAHYFAHSRRLVTACFKYEKITTWDIELPPEVIATNYDTKAMREALITQVNDLMLKGHEVFSALASEAEAEKEHAAFKQHMEGIHLALTSGALNEQPSAAGVVRSLWSVSDKVIAGEKMLRDAQDKWSSPLNKNSKCHQECPSNVEEKSDVEENTGDSGSSEFLETISKFEDHQAGTEDDEEKGDKKTVKQILAHLLSNNQPSNQSGMIISGGVIPVVVFSGEIGSVIAATLASVQYQRQLQTLLQAQSHTQASQSEQEDAENSTKDKTDGEKSKAKSNEHIEVLLKDGLLCRVYYAAQFQRLRTMLLPPLSANANIDDHFHRQGTTGAGEATTDDHKDKSDSRWWCGEVEEGFVRSLSMCVAWAARGGKSGSTFCKTKDDRYVLKEMTKPEWQQFLEFAPHYFNYVINCHQNKIPTMLTRIVGVYSVGGAGNGVLVMEHLLYARAGAAAVFDLKGAARHRRPAAPVLMDEDLLRMRWERPLYVSAEAGAVLRAAAERDAGFLAAHGVMDYSLLLALHRGSLVLGVIDYIRTFTWDKKLEHYVKKNLGSGQPTVVSPEQYRRRFCAALRKYFLPSPAPWDHLHRGLRHQRGPCNAYT